MTLVCVSSLRITERGRPPSRCRRWSVPRRSARCRRGRPVSSCRRRPRIPDRAALPGHQRVLGRVEAAVAAPGDDVGRPRGRPHAVLDVAADRVRLHVAEQAGRQAGGRVGGDRLGHQRGEARVGDEQRPAHAERPAGRGQLGDAARAEEHLRGIVPAAQVGRGGRGGASVMVLLLGAVVGAAAVSVVLKAGGLRYRGGRSSSRGK